MAIDAHAIAKAAKNLFANHLASTRPIGCVKVAVFDSAVLETPTILSGSNLGQRIQKISEDAFPMSSQVIQVLRLGPQIFSSAANERSDGNFH